MHRARLGCMNSQPVRGPSVVFSWRRGWYTNNEDPQADTSTIGDAFGKSVRAGGTVRRIGSIPRKRRTRQHVIADQSLNFVERFIIDEGHTAQRLERDYGYDLLLFTFDERGYTETGSALLQLKASESLELSGTGYVFQLDIRDYNLWMMERMPVFLVLFDAGRRRAYWLHIQGYFQTDPVRRPGSRVKSVRVRVPKHQVVNQRAIARMREIKRQESERLEREVGS